MKVIKCAIIDDEPLARKVLNNYIDELENLSLVGTYKSVMDFSSASTALDIDIIFIDINMPMITGLEFVKSYETNSLIVFTTAYPEFAVDAFELQAFDYLVKPISFERFFKCIENAKKHFNNKEDNSTKHVSFKENKRLYKIPAFKILFIQAYGDYIKIHSEEKVYTIKFKMSEFAYKLTSDFIQVHRSYIINLNQINFIEGNLAVIGEHKIPISESYKPKFIAAFKNL